MIGGLSEGGTDRPTGEAWKQERRFIAGSSDDVPDPSTSLVPSASGALVKAGESSSVVTAAIREEAVPEGHPWHVLWLKPVSQRPH